MPASSLSTAQRAALRAQAHALKPIILVGADGLSDAVLAETDRALQSHELLKIRVFGDDRAARLEIAEVLCAKLGASLVQHIGKLLVIWRERRDDDQAGITAPAQSGRRVAATMPPPHLGVAETRRANRGAGPRMVTVVKPTGNTRRRARPIELMVRGNERVTAGGNIKRAKRRVTSVKRLRQD